MNIRNWKKVAQNRDSRKKAVEQARTLYRLYRFIRRSLMGYGAVQLDTWLRTFRKYMLPPSSYFTSTLNIKIVYFSETLVAICNTTRYHNAERRF
jgi:hypothetical protein